MKIEDILVIFSHLINVIIFIYFSIILLKINFLDVFGLSISAFGILMSLVSNIVSILQK